MACYFTAPDINIVLITADKYCYISFSDFLQTTKLPIKFINFESTAARANFYCDTYVLVIDY